MSLVLLCYLLLRLLLRKSLPHLVVLLMMTLVVHYHVSTVSLVSMRKILGVIINERASIFILLNCWSLNHLILILLNLWWLVLNMLLMSLISVILLNLLILILLISKSLSNHFIIVMILVLIMVHISILINLISVSTLILIS